MNQSKASEEDVSRYYDSNTERFLQFGQGGAQNGIHRAVLTPGRTMKQAFHCQEDIVLQYIRLLKPSLVYDLGCGTGSSLLYLNSHYKTVFRGLTLSEKQAEMAEHNCRQQSNIEISRGSYSHEASYKNLPPEGPRLFFAVESYLHAEDREGFFRLISRYLKPGDLVLVIDDFLAGNPGKRDSKILHEFQTGWQAPQLITDDQCRTYAAGCGFELVENRDLSPWLLMNRFRDRLIEFLVPFLKPLALSSPWYMNLLGGQALSRGSRKGLIQYRFLAFKRI